MIQRRTTARWDEWAVRWGKATSGSPANGSPINSSPANKRASKLRLSRLARREARAEIRKIRVEKR